MTTTAEITTDRPAALDAGRQHAHWCDQARCWSDIEPNAGLVHTHSAVILDEPDDPTGEHGGLRVEIWRVVEHDGDPSDADQVDDERGVNVAQFSDVALHLTPEQARDLARVLARAAALLGAGGAR